MSDIPKSEEELIGIPLGNIIHLSRISIKKHVRWHKIEIVVIIITSISSGIITHYYSLGDVLSLIYSIIYSTLTYLCGKPKRIFRSLYPLASRITKILTVEFICVFFCQLALMISCFFLDGDASIPCSIIAVAINEILGGTELSYFLHLKYNFDSIVEKRIEYIYNDRDEQSDENCVGYSSSMTYNGSDSFSPD